MTAVFLETSALLRMIFGEHGGDVVVERLQEADRAIASRLLRVEAERALIRLSLDHPRSHRQVLGLERELKLLWPKIDFIEVSRDICDLAGRLAPRSRLRTLDAIHLATFFRARELDPAIEILTYDERIKQET
ncbi:MAG: putative nucleic acid-binding protein, contains domain [Acidobacteria bacterium]|jgi:predicted nucleic acid-binding protein|nr:putative nucleic acid-binding protein, contains domain [Acidobacteriota bacterium]